MAEELTDSGSAPRPVLIDCDPGIDDAVALLLAWAAPEAIDLLAVTTVAGNVPLANTSANAVRLRELAGREETPVLAGCPRPLVRALVTAAHVHGASGLDGSGLPSASGVVDGRHAVDHLRDTVLARPGEVTIVAVGPLTNVAAAIVAAPEVATAAREIVIMGGAEGAGNVTPHAEFNFHVDPHAARIVMESGARVVLHGLDVTRKARATSDWMDRVAVEGGAAGRAVAGMLRHYSGAGGAALHDALAVGWLLWPELFTSEAVRVDVATDETEEIGRSRVARGVEDAGVRMAFDLDVPVFMDRLAERLARYG
jgi:purine nucleosidase